LIISPRVLEKPNDEYIEFEKIKALAESKNKDSIEQKMLGVHYVENSTNQKGWELFATEASGTTDSQWILKKVKVQFFSNDNSSFIVTGDVGEVDGTSKDMLVRGHVTTTSSNGYSFKTDTLRYVAQFKQMTSSDQVEMLGPADTKGAGFKLNGVGLLVDIVRNKMTILDQVHAEKKIDLKNFNLTSLTAEFSNKSQEALFSGKVKMNLGPTKIEAPHAYFTYSNKTKSLEKIVLKKDVKLVELDKKAQCEELEINVIEDKMTLRGQPKVQQGEDEIVGEEIVFLDGGKKVKINKVDIKGQKK
jgi:LPS export ABC transporter protein LptC